MKFWITGVVLSLAVAHPAWADAPIIDAAKAGDDANVAALLKAGTDVNTRAADGATALEWAVYRNDVDLAKRLIRARADVKLANNYGATPMSLAATTANVEMLKLLLDAGADVESPNADGQTALMIVARTNHVDAAKLLIDHGADVNAKEHWREQSPIIWAAAQSQPEMVKFLAAHGADVNAHSVVNHWKRHNTAEPRQQHRPTGGFTALMYAARQNCIACAKALVDAGADINLPNPDGVTPLGMATLNARYDLAAYLLSAGADPNRWDIWGRAPLYNVVDYNTLPIGGRSDRPPLDDTSGLQLIEILLKAGANPDMQLKLLPPERNLRQDRAGDHMLTVGTTPLIRAAKAGDAGATRLLLQYKADPNLPNSLGISPLMSAAGIGSIRLDTRGVYRNEKDGIEVLKLLLAAGADINATDNGGQTALYGAASWGWNDMVSYLVAQGASLKTIDKEGHNVIDAALGKAGGPVRLGIAPQVHEDTAELLKKLIQEKAQL